MNFIIINKDFYSEGITKSARKDEIQIYVYLTENKNLNNTCNTNILTLINVLGLQNNEKNRAYIIEIINDLVRIKALSVDVVLEEEVTVKANFSIYINNRFNTYVKLPFGILNLRNQVSSQALGLFILLRSFENVNSGYAYPKQKDIENAIAMTNKTIKKYTIELKEKGLISTKESKYNKDKGRKENICYYINHKLLCEMLGIDYKEYINEFGIVNISNSVFSKSYKDCEEKQENTMQSDSDEIKITKKRKEIDSLKEKVSRILIVDINEIVISSKIREAIKKYGEDLFFETIEKFYSDKKYKWIWTGQGHSIGERVSTFLKRVIENELDNEYNEKLHKLKEVEMKKELDNMDDDEFIAKVLTNINPCHRELFKEKVMKESEYLKEDFSKVLKCYKNQYFLNYEWDYNHNKIEDLKEIEKAFNYIQGMVDIPTCLYGTDYHRFCDMV